MTEFRERLKDSGLQMGLYLSPSSNAISVLPNYHIHGSNPYLFRPRSFFLELVEKERDVLKEPGRIRVGPPLRAELLCDVSVSVST